MARKTLVELATQIAAFADNINGERTEAEVRDLATNIRDSFVHLDDFEDHVDDFDALALVVSGKVDTTTLNTALDTKRSFVNTAQTGTVISMDASGVYGTYGTPLNNPSFTFLGPGHAQLGAEVVIIHQAGAEPTFSGVFHKLPTSGAYNVGQVNFITLKYVDTNLIIYRIDRY